MLPERPIQQVWAVLFNPYFVLVLCLREYFDFCEKQEVHTAVDTAMYV